MLRMKGGLNRLNPFLSTSGVLVEHSNVLAGLKLFVSSKFGAHLCVGMSFRHIMGCVESSGHTDESIKHIFACAIGTLMC